MIDVMERLSAANPVPECPPLPIEEIWSRLDVGTDRRSKLPGSRSPRRRSVSARLSNVAAVVTTLSTAVAITIALVAIALLGHSRKSAVTHPTAPAATHTPTIVVPPRRVSPRINLFAVAKQNVRDVPLRLFERNPAAIDATPAATWTQTVIPSTVRRLGTFTLAGVGAIQYWVADTKQHGVCGALRTSNGQWLGLQHEGKVGGNMPGCYPTRAQVGAGALIIDGFDFIQSSVTGRHGQHWYIIYGAVSTPQTPTRVRDTFSGTSASLVSGHYFAIALHPVGNDYGDDVHLEAFDASDQRIATQGKPVAGSTITKCVGTYHVVHERIPGTHRTARIEEGCSRFAKVTVK
jgi:hypothetical protein